MSDNIGNEIKLLREQAGLTQTDLAKELLISKSVVSAYENGTRYPSFRVLKRLNEILGLQISDNQKEHKITVDITDLTPQQQDIIRMTIKQFRNGNEQSKL